MGDKIQAIRGMSDVLPSDSMLWRQLESVFTRCMAQYGYQEIRTPLLENTQLFKRSIGEVTDIVEKEMYTFSDRNGESMTLRPEGTAGCLRACIENGLLYHQEQKLWYMGPMFRYERPQKGRYRQFYQFGVEALGFSQVASEIEMIAMCRYLWRCLHIEDHVVLQINTLGELTERDQYRKKLVDYFETHFDRLDADSQRRLAKNPLRILDSKNPDMASLLDEAPKLMDFLGEESKQRFAKLCDGLNALKIPYIINPFLVRGLDYYGHLVFEWVTDKLGSQATVCAGGRYDALVGQLGGEPTPAVGFAIGEERLLLLIKTLNQFSEDKKNTSIFLMATDEESMKQLLMLAERLRNEQTDWQVITNLSGGSLKSQFKKADKRGADVALIIGEAEAKTNTVGVKHLRQHIEQITLPQEKVVEYLQRYW